MEREPSKMLVGAKNVTIEQDKAVSEVVSLVEDSLVGIFASKNIKDLDENTDILDPNNYYHKGEEEAQGLIVTSDGWIISNLK